MARDQFQDVAIDSNGNVVTTTQVSVFNARTTNLVPGSAGPFTTEQGAALRGNPFLANTGAVEFWMETGEYDVKIEDMSSPPKFATKTVRFNSRPPESYYGPQNPQPVNVGKTFRTVHGFSLDGILQAGDRPPGFFVDLAGGQSAKIVAVRHYVKAVSATWKLRRNGVDVAGWTANATTVATTLDPADVAVAVGDLVEIEVVSVGSNAAAGLGGTVILEHTV